MMLCGYCTLGDGSSWQVGLRTRSHVNGGGGRLRVHGGRGRLVGWRDVIK